MSEDIRRVRYYQQQYLGADDLADEQAYHRDMRRRHNLAHHTWGVVVGLDMRIEEDTRLWIGAGMAVDGFGREIFVLAAAELGPEAFLAEKLLTGMQPVWVAYHEEDTGPARYGYAECEDGTLRRVVENYRLFVGEPEDPDGRDDVVVAGEAEETSASIPYQELPREEVKARWYVLLGEVFWDAITRTFLSVEETKRPWTGAVAQTVWAPAGDLRLADRRPAADLQVTVEGKLQVDDLHTAKGDIELHGTSLVALNGGGGGQPVSLGRSDPGGASGVDLYLEIGLNTDAGKSNRLLVRSDGGELLSVAQDGATDIHGDTTVRDGMELRLDGGRLGIARQGSNPPQWLVRQPDPGDGEQLQFRETIGEADPDGRVVFELLQTAGNDGDPVLRLNDDAGATFSPAQLKALTHGGFTALHQHAFATTAVAGRVEIAEPSESGTNGGSGARLVMPANDPRLLTQAQKNGLTGGAVTTLHQHSTAFINETRQVWLYADEGATDTFTVNLGGPRRVLASTMLVGTERGPGGFLSSGDYADAYIDVFAVNGSTQPTWFFDGSHFGPIGAAANLRPPSYLGLATTITFRLRAFEGRAWALGVVFYEMP